MKTHTRCQQCGKRKQPPKGTQRYVGLEHYERDPYCSRTCCEKAHGITDQPGDPIATGGLHYDRMTA